MRTLAEGEGRYNPIGYDVGTVWPFDNSIIARGLRKYGSRKKLRASPRASWGPAQYFYGRLPEAFGGYPRQMTKYPVQYPTACSPQAWSTSAPLLLLRAVLGLEALGDNLVVDPALANERGLAGTPRHPRAMGGRIDAFGRGRIDTSRPYSSQPVAYRGRRRPADDYR